jgi:TorA maturation chaperone TorD
LQHEDLRNSGSWLKGRAFLYAFLSAVFRDHLTVGWIENILGSGELQLVLAGTDEKGCPEKNEIREILQAVVKDWTNMNSEKELNLQKEYARLFLLPEGVHPYESIYLGKKKLMMDRPWEKVREFYRRLGLEKERSELHPEDHLAVELGFMASLAYMTVEAKGGKIKDLLSIQEEFLQEHPGKWVHLLAADLLGKTKEGDFYQSVAQILDAFVRLEKRLFSLHAEALL